MEDLSTNSRLKSTTKVMHFEISFELKLRHIDLGHKVTNNNRLLTFFLIFRLTFKFG